jgi:hypothetical protein
MNSETRSLEANRKSPATTCLRGPTVRLVVLLLVENLPGIGWFATSMVVGVQALRRPRAWRAPLRRCKRDGCGSSRN